VKRLFDRVLRIAIGGVFLLYALAKFSGTQFSHFEIHEATSDVAR